MKKFLIAICCGSLTVACHNSNESSAPQKSDSASMKWAPTVSSTNEKGLELIGSSDCTTCHKLDKSSETGAAIGPAYSDVAAKYAPAADSTVNRLVQKVIKGGTGVWGSVPMTPHPALSEADVREMVKYILSLKKS